MSKTDETKKACTYAQRVYIAFVFTLVGVFLALLCVELANEGGSALGLGLSVAVAVMVLFGVIGILDM